MVQQPNARLYYRFQRPLCETHIMVQHQHPCQKEVHITLWHNPNNIRIHSNLSKEVQQRNIKSRGIDWACSLRSPDKQSKRVLLMERLVRPS